MRTFRIGLFKVLVGLFCVMVGLRLAHGASLPVPTPQPYWPQWWSTAVAGPLITLQQDDATAHQAILQLRKADGTVEALFTIDGDGILQGVLSLGNFTTVNLPTGKPVGSVAFDITANAPKYLNNSSVWAAFPGSGTVTGTGTTNTYTKWTNGAGGVLGNAMQVDDGTKVSLLAAPPVAANTALYNLGGAIAAGSAQGNFLGANSSNAFAGDFIDFEYGGTPKFVVDYNGNVTDKGLTPNAIVYSSSGDVLSSALVTSDLNLTTGTLGLTTQAGVAAGTYSNSTVTVNGKGIVTGISSGSISGISGSGTVNTIPKFTASAQLGNSDITDDGTTITNTKAVVNQGSLTYKTTAQTTTYTAGNVTIILCDASGGGFTVNLPAASASVGLVYQVIKTDATGNTVTVARAGGDTINGATTATTSTQYGQVQLACGNATTWYTPTSVANTLQQVMTAGNTSTVSSPMILSPSTGTSLQATTADYSTAASFTGSASAAALNINQTYAGAGATVQNEVSITRSGAGSGTNTSALLLVNDTTAAAKPLVDFQSSGASKFSVTKAGVVTVPALASAGFLSTDGSGVFTVNGSTPVTSESDPLSLHLTGGTMSGNISLNADNSRNIGTSTTALGEVYSHFYGTKTGQVLAIDAPGGVLFQTGTGGAGVNEYVALSGASHFGGSGDLRGTASTSAGTTIAVTFSEAYSSGPASVVITPASDPGVGLRYWVSGVSTAGFTINTSSASTQTFYWVAIQ